MRLYEEQVKNLNGRHLHSSQTRAKHSETIGTWLECRNCGRVAPLSDAVRNAMHQLLHVHRTSPVGRLSGDDDGNTTNWRKQRWLRRELRLNLEKRVQPKSNGRGVVGCGWLGRNCGGVEWCQTKRKVMKWNFTMSRHRWMHSRNKRELRSGGKRNARWRCVCERLSACVTVRGWVGVLRGGYVRRCLKGCLHSSYMLWPADGWEAAARQLRKGSRYSFLISNQIECEIGWSKFVTVNYDRRSSDYNGGAHPGQSLEGRYADGCASLGTCGCSFMIRVRLQYVCLWHICLACLLALCVVDCVVYFICRWRGVSNAHAKRTSPFISTKVCKYLWKCVHAVSYDHHYSMRLTGTCGRTKKNR